MKLTGYCLGMLFLATPLTAQNLNYVQHNLVADTAGTADNMDPNLKGLWGVSASPTSPFWVSNTSSGTATLYNGAGTPFPAASPLVVAITPGAASQSTHGSPTGQVNNGTGSFPIANGKPASFIFATLDGMIAAWNGGATAEVKVDNSGIGAEYTGLAIGISSKGPTLYAADYKFGHIDVFDSNFQEFRAPGGFVDPTLSSDLVPFNIVRLGRHLVVTFTGKKGGFGAGAGSGAVSLFDLDGTFLSRLATGGTLNAPWGVAIAPSQFGTLSYSLLIGNFGDGRINAYDIPTGTYIGSIKDATGAPIQIPGLWAIQFGSGSTNGGDANTLYFASDVDGTHGLFGSLRPNTDSVQP